MNHKLLSNMLFGCSVGSFIESFYMIQHQMYADAIVVCGIAMIIMYVSWVIFKHREEVQDHD